MDATGKPIVNEEIHPWNWFGPSDSKVLLVGTFPSARRNWSYDFFYPNKVNLFWKILADISGMPLQHFSGDDAVSERKAILGSLKITLTDMGAKIARIDDSSLDEKLVPLRYMDIFRILDERPLINKILFTSSSGPVSSTKWFNDYLKQRGIAHRFPKARPIKSRLTYGSRQIDLAVLYSPSRRAAGRMPFNKLVEMYREEICVEKHEA